jgi:hypothetical protein
MVGAAGVKGDPNAGRERLLLWRGWADDERASERASNAARNPSWNAQVMPMPPEKSVRQQQKTIATKQQRRRQKDREIK